MRLRAGGIAAVVVLTVLAGCNHGSHGSKSSGGNGGKPNGNSAMHDDGKSGRSNGGGPAPYVSLPALDPQTTYRMAMEYCDVQGKVAVFRGMQLVRQQQMA